jgi:hypothetical protein
VENVSDCVIVLTPLRNIAAIEARQDGVEPDDRLEESRLEVLLAHDAAASLGLNMQHDPFEEAVLMK